MATKTYYEPKEEAVPWLVGIDMQKFICGYGANFIGSSYVSCVGIGCQLQWGINTGGAVRTSTLPIPFTNVFLAVASTSSEWCCPGCSATNTTVTTRAYQSNRPDVAQPSDVNWIIIGCQPQWGFTNNTGRPYITFPFKFSNVFTAISCICHNGSPSEANTVYNVSISGMNIGASGGGSGKYWCAFGVAQQQWGKILGDTVNLKIINFPVSFNECFGGLALFNGDPVAAAEYATITDITNTNFKIYMYANNAGTGYANANIFYLFLGAQPQWGFEETETKTIAFPISFESIKYVFLSKIYGPASGGADTVAYNFFRKSLTGVSFDYAYTRNWLAIGGQ